MFKYFYGVIVVLFAYVIYSSMTEVDLKSSRLACQKEVTTFETIRKPAQMQDAIKALKSGNYILESEIRFSKYMKSQLGKYLSIEDVDKMLKEIISIDANPGEDALIIDYSVYENELSVRLALF